MNSIYQRRQLMNKADIVHMVEMAATQPSNTGWTSEHLKVLFWSPSRKWNYLNKTQLLWDYKSNVLGTGFLVTQHFWHFLVSAKLKMPREQPLNRYVPVFILLDMIHLSTQHYSPYSPHIVQGCKECKQDLIADISAGCLGFKSCAVQNFLYQWRSQ